MDMMHPSEMVSRLDLVVLELAAAGFSLTSLGFLEHWGIYRAKRRFGGHSRWAQPPRARLGLLARPGGLCSPRSTPRRFSGPLDVFWSIKNPQKVSLRLDSTWY